MVLQFYNRAKKFFLSRDIIAVLMLCVFYPCVCGDAGVNKPTELPIMSLADTVTLVYNI